MGTAIESEYSEFDLPRGYVTSHEVIAWRRNNGLTLVDAGYHFGVTNFGYRYWEMYGISGAWAILWRLKMDYDELDVTPYDAPVDMVHGLLECVGGVDTAFSLAVELGTTERNIRKWIQNGRVPGKKGFGRLVQICYSDFVGQ